MNIALSLLVLTAIALVGGAYVLLKRGKRRQAWLMLALAVVMALNVAIWTVPTQNGDTLAAGPTPH
jgi:drug/metabolite transporter superfamily protein YnfA